MKHALIISSAGLMLLAGCLPTPAEPPAGLAGDWIGTGYTCPAGVFIDEERIRITVEGDVVTATKIVGDDCVPAGEVTWTGTYADGQIPVKFTVSNGPGTDMFTIDQTMTVNEDGTITGFGTTLTRP